MIPNLPRPFLWTEIKTMNEILWGDILIMTFYDVCKKINKYHPLLHKNNEVLIFNELYYQLTKFYYENPGPEDYRRYYADIRTDLGQVDCADLVMTMMYHYCRLGESPSFRRDNQFLRTIRFEQEKNIYWLYFVSIKKSVLSLPNLGPDPQRPCPVPPEKLQNMNIEWAKITRNFDLDTVKSVIALWEKKEEKSTIAGIIINNLLRMKDLNYEQQLPTARYLIKIMGSLEEDVTSLKFDSNSPSDNEKFLEAANYILEYDKKTELVEKDKEILQLKKKNKEVEEKLIKAEKLNEKRLAEAEKWHRSYEISESEVAKWRSKYEIADAKLKSDGMILETARRYLSDKPFSPDILLRRFPDDEAYKKKEKALEDKIKNLQEKLGKESVSLSVLAEGLKDYAEEAGLSETHHLFNQLNNLLISVPAWTKNVPELKKFFKNARKNVGGVIIQADKADVEVKSPGNYIAHNITKK